MKRFLGVLLAGILISGGLAGCARAEFEVSPLSITPSQASPGESFTVSAEITNVGGADGVYTATLTVNGAEVATKDVAVAAGGTETVSFTLTEETPGNYTVVLNDLTGSFEVLKLPSAQEIVDSVIEALDDIRTYEFEWDMSMDMVAEIEDEIYEATMALTASGALDPENRQIIFDITVNWALPEGDEVEMGMEQYVIGNMGYIMMDVPGTDPTWNKVEIPEAAWGEIIDQMSQLTMLTEHHTELLRIAQVEVIGIEKVNGLDCYILKLTPDTKQLLHYVWLQAELGELLSGETELPLLTDKFLQEILCSFSVKQWVCKDTYFLTKVEIDVDVEILPEALSTPEEEVAGTIDIAMDFLAYNHNQPISIALPPEAEEAAAAQPAPVPTPPPGPPAPAPVPVEPAEPAPAPENVITFPDEELEEVIRETLVKLWGEDLTVTELTGDILTMLFALDADSLGITDLSGIEHCVNLMELSLYDNQISDLSPLSSLTNLTWLRLHYNLISDISPLSSLTNLEDLILDGNQISDISPLSSLTNLKTLTLGNNRISDISALSSLTKLYMLGLPSNQISDISALASLTNLINLFLMQNQISDISPLSGLIELRNLLIDGNQISDISPLVENSGLGEGDEVHLGDNKLDLSEGSDDMENIKILEDRGVVVYYE